MVRIPAPGCGFFGLIFGDFGLAIFNRVGVPDSQGSCGILKGRCQVYVRRNSIKKVAGIVLLSSTQIYLSGSLSLERELASYVHQTLTPHTTPRQC